MMRASVGVAFLALLGVAALTAPARACTDVGEPGAACDNTTTSNLIEENDSFIDHHDKHYTQGLRLSFASSEQTPGDPAYSWLRAVADHVFLPDALQGELERSGRTNRPFSILLMDLDKLKEINDRYGHQTGTRAICRVAEVLRQHCRAIDTAARYGGDEFALLLPETGEAAARQVASRIKGHLEASTEEPKLSVSIGVATHPPNGTSAQHLLEAADLELYARKASRGRKVHSL